MYSSLREMTEAVVGKRKSKESQEFDQPPNKKQDSFSGDEAYCSFSSQSLRGDETDMSSNEDVLEIEEEPKLITAEMLQINYKYLKNEMESRELIDILHQYQVFTDEFLENCKETPSRMRRNDLLIKEIYYIAISKDSEVLHQFTTSLIQTEQSYIIDHLKNHSSSDYLEERYTAFQRNRFLQKVNQDDTIEPRDFIDDLIENESMSFRDHEDVTRMDVRKNRVRFVGELVLSPRRKSWKIIKTVVEAYPKLFRDVENNNERSIVQQTGGAAVNIKLNLNCNGMDKELRAIEKRSVEYFKKEGQKNDVIMNDLVEKCRTLFEGLKISSIVIQLLTRDESSMGKIVGMVKQGKAVDWLLSILEENDKRCLSRLGVTKLQVLITVNTEGNLGNLYMGQDCICQLNQLNIIEIKDTVTGMITDVSTLLEQMVSFSDSPPHLLARIKKCEDKCATLLDCLIRDDVPKVWYCLLEEHIKKEARSVEDLLVEKLDRNIEFDRNDIRIHEEYLKNELELRTFLPIIRSWMNEKSEILLTKINTCSSRRSRMEEFLAFLLCEEDLGWFWEEVKIKHPYVWETMTISKRSSEQSEKDVLAIKLMNDTVVEEIDPIRLTKYLREETIIDLGFNDFKDIQSRKSRAQFILNRLTAGTIGDFMTALRQGGYEHIYRQIKAGSLAKQYVCPRIHSIKRPKRKIYKGVFDLPTKLCSDEVPTCWVNSNKAGESPLPTFSTHSTGYEYAIAQTSGIRSPASVGSLKDSESGFISGSDDFTCEIANTHDFDDEGISPCSPVSPTSLSPDTDSSYKAVKPSRRSRETLQRKNFKRMFQLMDSDISASRVGTQLRPNRNRLDNSPDDERRNLMRKNSLYQDHMVFEGTGTNILESPTSYDEQRPLNYRLFKQRVEKERESRSKLVDKAVSKAQGQTSRETKFGGDMVFERQETHILGIPFSYDEQRSLNYRRLRRSVKKDRESRCKQFDKDISYAQGWTSHETCGDERCDNCGFVHPTQGKAVSSVLKKSSHEPAKPNKLCYTCGVVHPTQDKGISIVHVLKKSSNEPTKPNRESRCKKFDKDISMAQERTSRETVCGVELCYICGVVHPTPGKGISVVLKNSSNKPTEPNTTNIDALSLDTNRRKLRYGRSNSDTTEAAKHLFSIHHL